MDKVDILIVDDRPSKLLIDESMLADLGANLVRANSGNEALAFLLKNDVGVVLAMGGFELADTIREHPRFQDTPIIFISAAPLTDTEWLKGYAHCAVDYVSVPIVPELLRAKVRVFAELYKNKRELERMSSQMMAAQDEERRRIARELHDGLGQELSLAKILADGLHGANGQEKVAELCGVIDNALQQVRSLSHLLHPPLLEELGLVSAIRWYVEGLTKRSGIETSLEMQPEDFPRLPAKFENAVYRIIQEALTNVFRHSGAKHVSIALRRTAAQLCLAVRDDGNGIPEEIAAFKPGSMGVGVRGMRRRVLELGGDLRFHNTNPGTLVEVTIPCRSEAD